MRDCLNYWVENLIGINDKNPPLYLFIIWEKSRNKSELIFDDLKKNFFIRDVYEVRWNKKKFLNNAVRFYGLQLPDAMQKAISCGTGSFLLVLVSDPNTKYGERTMQNGVIETVNVNVYDSKIMYRKWIGEEFAVHGSNSDQETNHDLILLLGKNKQDLEKELPEKWNGSIKKLESELIGHNGWKDLKQLLYVLNGTINYVILRNFEDLPDKLSTMHEDVDILTDNLQMMLYIINGEKIPLDNIDATLVKVKLGDKVIIFDLKYPDDHYYDEKWSKDILKRRILHPNGFYVPCKEDYFYTLLYHAVFHKRVISDDYKKKLSNLARELEVTEKIFNNFTKSKKFLKKYMLSRGYSNTTSVQYKVRRNEFIRLAKVAILLAKTQGMRFLLIKIKEKIKRTIFKDIKIKEAK